MGPGNQGQDVTAAGSAPQPYPQGSAGGEVWPRVSSRDARLREVPYLQRRLAEDPRFERVDLAQSIVKVVEYDGKIVGFGACQLVFRVEPLFLFPEFKREAPRFARRRATYLLIKGLDEWIADPERNTTGIRQYFCFVVDRVMQKLALSFGLLPTYVGGKFFGRRIFGRE